MNEHVPPGKSKSAQRSAAYRQRKREAGLRPVTLWVPDTRSPAFINLADKQSRAVASSDDEADLMAWLDQVRDWPTE